MPNMVTSTISTQQTTKSKSSKMVTIAEPPTVCHTSPPPEKMKASSTTRLMKSTTSLRAKKPILVKKTLRDCPVTDTKPALLLVPNESPCQKLSKSAKVNFKPYLAGVFPSDPRRPHPALLCKEYPLSLLCYVFGTWYSC